MNESSRLPNLQNIIAAHDCGEAKLPDKRCESCPYGYGKWDDSGDHGFWWCDVDRIESDAISVLRKISNSISIQRPRWYYEAEINPEDLLKQLQTCCECLCGECPYNDERKNGHHDFVWCMSKLMEQSISTIQWMMEDLLNLYDKLGYLEE